MQPLAPFQLTPPPRTTVGARSRLAFAEGLLSEPEVRPCAVLALRWLARHAGLERGLVALVDGEAERLIGLSGYGLSLADVDGFKLDLADANHPLVLALGASEPLAFNTGQGLRRPFETPLGPGSFHAVALGRVEPGEVGPGLLLFTTLADGPLPDEIPWAAELLGTRLTSLLFRRAQADERRHKRERSWLLGVLNAVTDPLLMTDGDGRILIANAGAERLLTGDETMSEGRRRAVALNNMLFSASLFKTTEGSGPTRQEVLLVDPIEGQDLLFEVLRSPVRIRRGEVGYVSVLRNVTDLRQAAEELEENYRRLRAAEATTRAERDKLDLILNSALDPILVTDPSGAIVLMNPPAERMFTALAAGRDPEAERRVRGNDAVFSSFVASAYATGAVRARGELSLTDPQSGTGFPVEAISAKLVSKHGEDTGIVTILHDLTDAVEKERLYDQVKRHSEELHERVREATAELAEQNELLRRQALELEQASAMKSQFLANVSHELRTPLNAILGYTHLMLEGVSGDISGAQRDKLGRIDANARHLLSVINDLLDIARIESGKMPVQLEERLLLPDLIEEVMREVEPLIARTRLAVDHEVAPEVPEIRSDRQKVKQIVLNLLSNALKFTPAGSVSIRVAYHGEEDRISVAVADTGIGISEEYQKNIFEAFLQA
ncbi:MAG: histidine kinase dimerization/phospho-acceptor domain-containing protein, partial [Thermoanaerobaculia bacterium]